MGLFETRGAGGTRGAADRPPARTPPAGAAGSGEEAIQMAMDVRRSRNTGLKVAAFARLPLQWPMIRAALNAARGD